jgi:hypothetical protein
MRPLEARLGMKKTLKRSVPTFDIPATITLPADFSESTDAWQDILPGAAVEITRSSWAEMLSTPAVKRFASLLNAAENHEKKSR